MQEILSVYPEMSPLASLAMVVVIALVHLRVGHIRMLRHEMDSPWLSASAGVAVGYVFIYLLPKLGDLKYGLAGDGSADFVETHYYFFVMIGFLAFYKVGWAMKSPVFSARWRGVMTWARGSGFVAYNLLLGYVITAFKHPEFLPVLLVTAILSFHLMGVDHHLRHAHPKYYDNRLRYLLVAGILLGWILGETTRLSDAVVAFWTAILAGGMLMLVFREELPDDLTRNVLPFTLAVVVSSLAIELTRA
jgi:hypothetical protein